MLQLNTIRAQPGATQKRKRLGRGSGSGLGATAGKGDKGQLARSGGKVRAGFEGGQMPLYRRLPKRGFTNVHQRSHAEVNLVDLERMAKGSLKDVSLETLVAGNWIKGRYDRLVVLGTGELTQAVKVKAHRVSAAAKAKIEKAGGSVEMLPIPGPQPREKKKKSK